MKPDLARIEALEQELGISGPAPKPAAEMAGYVVLMDSQDREASDRVPATFTVSGPRYEGDLLQFDIKIKEAPISLVPTRVGFLRAMAVLDSGGRMPACSPDQAHYIKPGDTFTITS